MTAITTAVNPIGNFSISKLFSTTIQLIGASLFIAICAQITLPLFFTPVPLSLQTFAILLVGGVLGSRKGMMSVLLYLFEGLIGLPFFVGGGSGPAILFGATGGYFFGFIIQAYLVGWFLEQPKGYSKSKMFAYLISACMIQLILGVLWLGQLVGWSHVLVMGFYPFIPGEILKSFCATKYLSSKRLSL